MLRLGMVALAGLLACCGTRKVGAPGAGAQPEANETARAAQVTEPVTAAAAGDAGAREHAAALSEAAARVILADQFRAAGLRVLYDVTIEDDAAFEVTLDGWDPDRRVGFEYVDAAERDVDLTPAERHALASSRDARVLVLDAASAEEVAERARRFLAQTGE